MRVVHLYDGHEQVYRGRGSVPRVVWNVARETAAAGHDVIVIERQWNGLPRRSTHEGVNFRRLDLWTGAAQPWDRVPYEMVESPLSLARLIGDRTYFAVRALQELRQLPFDVLHVHLPFAANVLLTVAPWLCQRTVYTAHLGELRLNALQDGGEVDGGDEIDVPGVVQRFSPDVLLARRAAATTVLNSSIREQFMTRGVPGSRLEVVPNGVNLERFGDVPEIRIRDVRHTYRFDDVRTVLFVGTVMPRKGVTDLVRAMADVVDAVDEDVRLVIAGETDLDEAYTQRIRALIEKHDLDDVVELVGFVSDEELPALYAAADMFALPSHEEGFGMTAVEAMAAGTPVVATRVGGMPWVLENGDAGRLVDVGAVSAMATEITTILDDANGKERMTEHARERARDFSWSAVATRVVNCYEEVLS